MMRDSHKLSHGLALTLLAAFVLGLGGCASTTEDVVEEPPETGSEFSDAGATAPPPEPVEDTTVAAVVDVNIDPVYFDFDRSEIRPDAVGTLQAGAKALNESGRKIIIAGHCDNRGSEEYNLALGERRAASVRRYLGNLGVPMRQMTIISYGEIQPAVQGNNEEAWAMNRRAEFETAD